MLTNKNIILGVSGSIAAYKAAYLASALTKLNAHVDVIMTQNATNFIAPLTFETLTKTRCITDTFDRNFEYEVEHISLGKKADIMIIAPATANVIAKVANGIADDMLSTTALSLRCPLMVAPAMNTRMYDHPATCENLETLKKRGVIIAEPQSGILACGDEGRGRMEEPEILTERIITAILRKKDLTGKKIVVTAGPTREAFDPVRYITNHSTGKMGYALAREAVARGASVSFITGPTGHTAPIGTTEISIENALELKEAALKEFETADAVIMAAAVADYRPVQIADNKIKKSDGNITVELEKTEDILLEMGKRKKAGQILCGFSMETENVIANSRKKLEKKNLDMIVSNNLKVDGAGFGTDTNVVTIITKETEESLPIMEKQDVAKEILDRIATML